MGWQLYCNREGWLGKICIAIKNTVLWQQGQWAAGLCRDTASQATTLRWAQAGARSRWAGHKLAGTGERSGRGRRTLGARQTGARGARQGRCAHGHVRPRRAAGPTGYALGALCLF